MADILAWLETYIQERKGWEAEQSKSAKIGSQISTAMKNDVSVPDTPDQLLSDCLQNKERVAMHLSALPREARQNRKQKRAREDKERHSSAEARQEAKVEQKRMGKAMRRFNMQQQREAAELKTQSYEKQRASLKYKLRDCKNLLFSLLPCPSMMPKQILLDTNAMTVSFSSTAWWTGLFTVMS